MAPVRIVDINYVAVPAAAVLPAEPIKLNAMEAQWVVVPLLQHVLFFEGDQLPPFDTVVHSLKSSLAATLATHAPLAGKLVHLADTGDVAVSYSASEDGVKFVVAESGADVQRLTGDEESDVQTFERLVPEVDMSVLPAPVLAVQATRLEGGGVVIGVTVHHGVADGRSLWRFVEAWVAACRGDDTPPASPTFDRSLVRLPGGEDLARSVLRKYAPNLPSAPVLGLVVKNEDRVHSIRRRFTLDAQLSSSSTSTASATRLCRPTCSALSRPFPDDDDMFLFFLDARGCLDPPVRAKYFSVCLSLCQARLPVRELRGEGALAAATVQGAIRKMKEDPLDEWEFLRKAGKVSTDRFVNVSGLSGFRAYEVADFGWGRPRRTEPVRMNQDGQVALRARDGEGVQVSVNMLQRVHIDAFKSEFLKLIR